MSIVANIKGALGLKPDKVDKSKEPPLTRKPMRKVSKKRRGYYDSPRGKFDLEYMGLVRKLHCVICDEWCMIQTTPTEAHHPICGRFGTRKDDNTNVIPLCQCHHKGTAGSDKTAIHEGKETWVAAYGPDHHFIAPTQDKISRIFGFNVEERPE